MRRHLTTIGLAAATALATGAIPAEAATVATGLAKAPQVCVGSSAGCLSAVQAALDAAPRGAVITVAPGTYAGGLTITRDVTLVGAGPSSTTIAGGGPVLTIGVEGSTKPPTVTLRGLTITGGLNTSVPAPQAALGGGILIPPGDGGTPGATVTITDAVIRDNHADPDGTSDCGFECAFALGGGIANSGRLTLRDTVVRDNTAGPSTSHSYGGGLFNDHMGTLTLARVDVTGNRSAATEPLGRVAEAGGIYSPGRLSIDDSTIATNLAEQSSAFTIDDDHVANAGGISVNGDARITNTAVRDNLVVSVDTNPDGITNAFGGGVVVKGRLDMAGSTITGNTVRVTASGQGIAEAGGLYVDIARATIRTTTVSDNTATATAADAVQASGGGILTLGTLTLERVRVRRNTAHADGGNGIFPWGEASGSRGGGIAQLDTDPKPRLTVLASEVTGNAATGSSGIVTAGGGIYTQVLPALIAATTLSGNAPDQCAGC